MPVANKNWPSGVSFKRWQASGNSKSWISSIRRLRAQHRGVRRLLGQLERRKAQECRAGRSVRQSPVCFVFFQGPLFLLGKPVRQCLSTRNTVYLMKESC